MILSFRLNSHLKKSHSWLNSVSSGHTTVVVDLGTSIQAVPVTVPYIRNMQYAYPCVKPLHQSRYNPWSVFRNPIGLVETLSCDAGNAWLGFLTTHSQCKVFEHLTLTQHNDLNYKCRGRSSLSTTRKTTYEWVMNTYIKFSSYMILPTMVTPPG